jgi:hypothetical protein
MGWSAIDFNLIQTGMITRGPASVSFGEYLNEFLKAGLERYRAITGDSNYYVKFPDIPNIDDWQQGWIRGPEFASQFRGMIGIYKEIWDNNVFYSQDVLTDILNRDDYILEDSDAQAAMGDEAWGIFQNFESMNLQEVFKASLLNGLFELYKITNLTDIIYLPSSTPAEGRISPDTNNPGNNWSSNTFSPWEETRADAQSWINSNSNDVVLNGAAFLFDYDNEFNDNRVDPYRLRLTGAADGGSLIAVQKNIENDIVNSEVYFTASLQNNEAEGVITIDNEQTFYSEAATNDFDLVADGDPSILIEIEESSSIYQSMRGTSFKFERQGFLTVPSIPFPKRPFPSEDGARLSERSKLFYEVGRSGSYMITNVNVPDMQYFIDAI